MPRENLTDSQWQQLLEAPPAIARGVAAAAGSTGQSETELAAFLGLIERTRDESGDSGMLAGMASGVHALLAAGSLDLQTDDAVAEGIHAARRAGAILSLLSDEREARAIRLWLLDVGRTVAQAAREGGIIGLGGELISAPEREAIAAISDALGLSEPAVESG